jgi:hypothetical protein
MDQSNARSMTDRSCDGASSCYLSVVVTTRNDDHGGDPLKRLQVFVNCFDEQCRRTGLDAEVIIVEWNPPPDRPRIASLLVLPARPACVYRFIEVPAETHATLRGADVLPLFQMIAKNVGVRRARGRFVLATNIDIIFSMDLIELMASHRLEPNCLYRVDRHDVESDVRVGATLEEQLSYCASHHLRIHTRSGSYPVEPLGGPSPSAGEADIVDGRALRLGSGWFVREGAGGGRSFRWASDRVELVVDPRAADISGALSLQIEIDCPGELTGSFVDLIAVENHRLLARRRINGHSCLELILDDRGASERRIELQVMDGGAAAAPNLPIFERRAGLQYRVLSIECHPAAAPGATEYPLAGWTNANVGSGLALMPTADGLMIQSDPRSFSYCTRFGPLRATRSGSHRFELAGALIEGGVTIGVLSSRGRFWIPSRLAVHRHSTSFWFTIDVDLRAGQPFWLLVSNHHPDGNGVSSFLIHRLDGPADVSQNLPARGASRLWSRPLTERAAVVYAGVAPWLRETRIELAKSARRLGATGALADFVRLRLVRGLRDDARRRRIVCASAEFQNLKEALDASVIEINRLRELSGVSEMLQQRRPSDLHVNGCGDFQLMAREHWEVLRGYPEFETFSMNIDAMLSYMADAAGVRERVLDFPIYHLEHEIGSGWSPEGEALLRRRIAERGITWIDATTVHLWAVYMRWFGRPMIFNGPDWGLANAMLVETTSLQSAAAPS